MNTVPASIVTTLRGLKAKPAGADAFLNEVTKLADLDDMSDTLDRAERIFALRRRIRFLHQRIRELEAHS